MKRARLLYWQILACVLCACIPIAAAQKAQITQNADPRIENTKPIAYLLFDHIGQRDPLEPDEGATGLYLRLQNNIRLPLVVAIVKNAGKSASVPSLLDEVIPNPKFVLGSGVPWIPSPGFPSTPGWDDLQGFPNEDEAGVSAAEFDANRQCKKPGNVGQVVRPSGYGWATAPVYPMLAAIPPGGALLFSLPMTHVSREWHIEIPFRLALAHDGKDRPPYDYLAFFWEDLPEVYRKAHDTNPKPPAAGKVTPKHP